MTLLQQALLSHQNRRLAEAELLYRKVLSSDPRNFDALHLLGILCAELGKYDEAEKNFRAAISADPKFPACYHNFGLLFVRRKQYQRAVEQFDKALALAPNFAPAHCDRGSALKELGRFDEALASLTKAAQLAPNVPVVWCNRANILFAMENCAAALNDYGLAIRIDERFLDAWVGRANAFLALKDFGNAEAAFARALVIDPNSAHAFLGRGNLHYERGEYDQALSDFAAASRIKPDLAEARLGQGRVYTALRRHAEALAAYDDALAANPDLSTAWLLRGYLLKRLWRLDEAIAAFDKALEAGPNVAEALLARGDVFFECNYIDRAAADFKKAISLKEDLVEARFADCFVELPILYLDEKEIGARREAYATKLALLHNDIAQGRVKGDLVRALDFRSPFYLACQGMNDYALQKLYGSIVDHVIKARYPAACTTQKASPGGRIRIGFVTTFFYAHSVWKIIKGWVAGLDRQRFEVWGYHIGDARDQETDMAAQLCDHLVQGARTLDDWRQKILADAPQVLIYPGLFMEPTTVLLAGQRLAPVQCSTWGHSETSGIPTIDYFLTSELMEPPDGQAFYTEKLVPLPNLSIAYEPLETEETAVSRAELGLRPDAVVFWCGQSLHKYLPQYDYVFSEIAKSVGNCQFVFIKHYGAEQISLQFRERVEKAFVARGLRGADHFVYLPRLTRSQFIGAIGQCDIILDPIGWTGCMSNLESFAHNLPIVTMPGVHMRGRHSVAFLTVLDCTETITNALDEYVAMAVRLAKDPEYRRSLSRKISANKHRIYNDQKCVESLEAFLESVARVRA
jgi:protein O-GlcNAc transferase